MILPYVSSIEQENGLISPIYKDLFDEFNPIIIEIEQGEEDKVNVINSNKPINESNLLASRIIITSLPGFNNTLVFTLHGGNLNDGIHFRTSPIFEYGDSALCVELIWQGSSEYFKYRIVPELTNISTLSGEENEKFVPVGLHIDDNKLVTFIPDYKGDDGWILLDENNQFSHKYGTNTKTSFTYSNTTTDPGYDGTFKILDFKYDAAGHITGLQTVTVSMPDAQTLPTGFTITPNITGDGAINVASQTAGTNGFSVKLEHEAPFSSAKTAKTDSTAAVSGYGSSGSIKVPKVSVDKFGHVTELSEETVNITMPAEQELPTSFTITPDVTGDGIVLVESQEAGQNGFSVKLAHDSFGSEIKADAASTTSISGYGGKGTLKIPKVIRDSHGHVSGLTEETVNITMPSKQTIPTSFNITPNVEGDGMVVVESQSASANGFNIKLAHDKVGNGSDANTASTSSISGYGKTGTLKIPKVTRDAWGHIDGLTEETVTITMPSEQELPTSFNINATGTGDSVISVTASGGPNSVNYTITHDKPGTSYTSGNTVTSIGAGESKTIKLPQINVDAYGHTIVAADEDVVISIPAASKVQEVKVEDDEVVELEVSTNGDITTITASHVADGAVYESENTTTSVDITKEAQKIKIPQIQVDKYGHTIVASDEEIEFKQIQFAGAYDATDNKAATINDVTSAVAKLNGAMHFKNVVPIEPGSENFSNTDYEAGDVVIYKATDSDIAIEYVFDGTTWYKLGDESLPQKITSAAIAELKFNNPTQADATGKSVAVINTINQNDGVISATGSTIQFNTALSSSNKAATMSDITTKINALDVTAKTLQPSQTIAEIKETNGKISATIQDISITHSQISNFNDGVSDLIKELKWNGLNLAPNETIDIVKQENGIINATKQDIAITSSQVTDFEDNVKKLFPSIVPTATDDGMIKLSATADGHNITITGSHDKVGTSKTSASNSGSISDYGASKTINIPKISTDEWGHVASIIDESVTITMPNVSDTKVTQTSKSDSAEYPLLAADSTIPSSGSASSAIYNANVTINPSASAITATTFKGNLDGTADYADVAGALGSSAGSLTNPIYFKDGKPEACTYSLNKTVPSNAIFTDTDTKVNTVLGTTTKAYLLGTSTTPTTTAKGVTAIADTGVYLDTTAGTLTATTFKGNLDGTASDADHADLADKASALSNYSIGSRTKPVYFEAGIPIACGSSFDDYLPLTGGDIDGNLSVSEALTAESLLQVGDGIDVYAGDIILRKDSGEQVVEVQGNNYTSYLASDRVAFAKTDNLGTLIAEYGPTEAKITEGDYSTSVIGGGIGFSSSTNSATIYVDTQGVHATHRDSDGNILSDGTIALLDDIPDSLSDFGVTASATELNYVDGVTSNIQTQLNKKMADFSIEIYNGTAGNPKPVRFASFNYSTCGSENGIAAKISMVSGHGNGTSYAFLQDAIIRVTHLGGVEVDNFKYYGANAGTYDGAARQYGDIFWLVDETNKIVDFYCLMGQYSRVQSTPWKRLTYSTGGTVTQHTSCTVYSSGTKNWGNNSDIALLSDITKVTLNGTSSSAASFYAPITSGTSGQVLKSNGSGAPTWVDGANLVAPKKITLVATAGQTAFSIPFEYDSLSSNLTVYFNGILMKETDNYTVNTSNNTVNLVGFSSEAGDVITIMGLLGAQSIDFGQEAINAINQINTAVGNAKSELQAAVDQASIDIDNLVKQLPSNWDDYLNKNANNVMNSGSKITMASNYAPSGNYDVTTKTYVDSAISTATSAIVTDIYKASSTAPTNTKLLWIDTGNSNVLKYHNGSSWTPVVVAWG